MPMFSQAEVLNAYRQEIRDPLKRYPRRVAKRSYQLAWEQHEEEESGKPALGKSVTPLPAMQSQNRVSGVGLLGHTLPEGSLEFIPQFGWVFSNRSRAPEAGIASESDIRRELMGSWLGELANYTHFCTWTFSRPVTVAGAMHFGRKHLRWLARWDVDAERGGTVSEFVNRNCYRDERERRKDDRARQKAARKRLQAFLATELGETGGLVHLHALAAKLTNLRAFCGVQLPKTTWCVKCCMVHSWPCGYARVFPYDPALGAKHYVSKYVIKGYLSDWELLGQFHCPGRACSAALH